mmetsp:Transcript_95753/g.255921  ORF Transcript_95753/g.255921 Transcript_95753/m.255921 type:complete len:233 (-) Transcript_95753:694-1392(-)
MVITVLLVKHVRTASCTAWSVSWSTLEVGSSITTTGACRNIARATDTSWRSPALSPVALTSTPFPMPPRPICRSTSCSSPSVRSENGSRLSRTLLLNSRGSCGMMPMDCRRRCSPTCLTSIPSIATLPDSTLTSRNNRPTSELFPAPVRPTTPHRDPPGIVNVTPRRAGGNPGRYTSTASLNSTVPALGHTFSESVDRCHAGSSGSWRHSNTRSNEVMLMFNTAKTNAKNKK